MQTTLFARRLALAAAALCASMIHVGSSVAQTTPSANPVYHHGPNTCKNGFVWRNAFDGDVVCVGVGARTLARQENLAAARNTLPGRIECQNGFVWRVARPADLACVSPPARDRVALENREAYYHVVGHPNRPAPGHSTGSAKDDGGNPDTDGGGAKTLEECRVRIVCDAFSDPTLDNGACGCRLKQRQ